MYRKPEVRSIGSAQEHILGPSGQLIEQGVGQTDDTSTAEVFDDCPAPGYKFATGDCAE